MLCQACNQHPATVRVIEITHPTKPAGANASSAQASPSPVPLPAPSPSAISGAPSSPTSTNAPLGSVAGDPSAAAAANDASNWPAPDASTAHEQWLCEGCAQTQSNVFGQAKDISEVWKLLKAQQPGARKQPQGVACPDCGMTMRDFRQRGRLGCAKDYEIFGAQLRDLLERIHGAARHVGRGPQQDEGMLLRRKRLDELQQALASAIREEAYEQAAKLRDEIQSLERS